jgi:hypothetical protein
VGSGKPNGVDAMRDTIRDAYPAAPYTSAAGTKFTVGIIFRMTAEELVRPAVGCRFDTEQTSARPAFRPGHVTSRT